MFLHTTRRKCNISNDAKIENSRSLKIFENFEKIKYLFYLKVYSSLNEIVKFTRILNILLYK